MILPPPWQPRTPGLRSRPGAWCSQQWMAMSTNPVEVDALEARAVVANRRCLQPPWSVPASNSKARLEIWLWVLRVNELEHFMCMFLDHSDFGIHERPAQVPWPFSVGLFVSSPTHEEHFNIFWMLILYHMCYKDLLIPVIFVMVPFWCTEDSNFNVKFSHIFLND